MVAGDSPVDYRDRATDGEDMGSSKVYFTQMVGRLRFCVAITA